MPIDSHLPQADPFSLVPTFKLGFKFHAIPVSTVVTCVCDSITYVGRIRENIKIITVRQQETEKKSHFSKEFLTFCTPEVSVSMHTVIKKNIRHNLTLICSEPKGHYK